MTSVHIFSETSDRAVFNYEFNDHFTAEVGDLFDFDLVLYSRMPVSYQKTFDKLKLKIGKYTVHNAYSQNIETIGNILYIFLKPVRE